MSEQSIDPSVDAAPDIDLTADKPGSVGDRMPPISADLEWAQDGRAPAPGEDADPGVARVSDRIGVDGDGTP